jgi:hypothetical protein
MTFDRKKRIGTGTYSIVHEGEFKHKKVAIKRFDFQQKSQIRIHSKKKKKKNSRLQLLLYNNHLLLRWCSQSLSINRLSDPTTATNSGTSAANSTATNVAQSAIAFNYNDGHGYYSATTARFPAAAFDSSASGC